MREELPEGWACSRLGSVLVMKYGKGLVQDRRRPGSVPVYGSNGVVGHHNESITSGPTIIIGRKGSVGEVHLSPVACWPIDTTYLINDFGPFETAFLLHTLRSVRLSELDRSTAIPGLSRAQAYAVDLLIPPLAEQRRIVAQVEALLARVQAARARLAKVPALLKRFRQSVLAAACSGDLTAEWREANAMLGNHGGPLTHLRSEHRTSWERRQIERFARLGKRRANDRWKTEYVEPTCPEVEEDTELPTGWAFSGLELLLSMSRRGMKTGPFGTSLKKSEHQTTGVPVLGIENIGAMRFRYGSKIKISGEKAQELAEFDAQPGDVLISRSGTVGEVCVVPPGIGEARISTNIMRVCLAAGGLLPQLFCYLFNGSPFVLRQVRRLCGGSTRDFLNQTILQSLRFPVPPLIEQHEIVRRIGDLFALADKIEARVAAATARVEKTTQAILAKAFRGELVPTEAELARQEGRDYEPASVLLERIGAEREAAGQGPPLKKSRRRVTAKSNQTERNQK